MKILNVWQSKKEDLKYFNVSDPIYCLGDYKIFKQFDKCYLYTYKNIGINQLVGLNKEHVNNLFNDFRPLLNTTYTPKTFVFDRAKETLKEGLSLIN